MTYTTYDQSLKFRELDLPEDKDIVYCIIKPEHKSGWIHSRKQFSSVYIIGTEFTPVYSLHQILQILTHYYTIDIKQFRKRYQVSIKISPTENYFENGDSIAEACGNLLITLIKSNKFFTEQVCKDVIKIYISTHE